MPLMHAALIRHPATDAPAVAAIEVALARPDDGALTLTYTLTGATPGLLIPGTTAPGRTDGLWRHTCCEAFVMAGDGPGYREFNFSPSGQWAAYAFTAYRAGGADLAMAAPAIACRVDDDKLELVARLPADALPEAGSLRLGLSAVVEAADGTVSYWALRHPPGRPDFHHADAFALDLDRHGDCRHTDL